MKTVNEIKVYEVDGTETKGLHPPELHVSNHWNLSRMVVLWIGGKKYTVLASELKRAIDNATNAHP